MPSSSSAQSIPKDSTPRILDFFILSSVPSEKVSFVPIVASITFLPAATFGAPHTTCSSSGAPVFTFVTCRWSESGCSTHSTTSATTTPAKPPGISSTCSQASTSRPIAVRICSNSSGERLKSTYSFNQLYETVILYHFYILYSKENHFLKSESTNALLSNI